MKRRDTIKSLLVGGVAGVSVTTVGCKTEQVDVPEVLPKGLGYGRTASEEEHDAAVLKAIFLNDHELETIAILCDIILPPTASAGSATDAEVPEFIEFIVKDLPDNQLPMRGGLMWLDGESNKRFDKLFKACSHDQQISIVEDIAYPNPSNADYEPGVAFFDLMRNLTLTGYYTTKMGVKDLGYKGNIPNVWDGVPKDVLDKHGLSYPDSK